MYTPERHPKNIYKDMQKVRPREVITTSERHPKDIRKTSERHPKDIPKTLVQMDPGICSHNRGNQGTVLGTDSSDDLKIRFGTYPVCLNEV